MSAGLTGVQLHSAFLPSLVREIRKHSDGKLRVIQVVDFRAKATAGEQAYVEATLHAVVQEGLVDAVLLDTSEAGTCGGTGVTFDWGHAASILQKTALRCCRLIVAGGLRPGNVSAAMEKLSPWGVDVVSGVEVAKGRKDPALVEAFVKTAKVHP